MPQEPPPDVGTPVQDIDALNDGEWLRSKWAAAMKLSHRKNAPAAGSTITSIDAEATSVPAPSSLPPASALHIPALIQKMRLMASQQQSSLTSASMSSPLPAPNQPLSDNSADSLAPVVIQQSSCRFPAQTANCQPNTAAPTATNSNEDVSAVSPLLASVTSTAPPKAVGGWSKLKSNVLNRTGGNITKSSDLLQEKPDMSRKLSLLTKSTVETKGTSAANGNVALATLGQDSYVLHGLVDRRHLNGTVATIVRQEHTESAGNQNDSKLLLLPDGSKIRLHSRNFSLLERAPPRPAVDSFGLREGEFVNTANIAKQKAQSLIKNKLTSSSRTSDEVTADDASVKLLQSCIAAHSQSPLDENVAAAFLDAIARSSAWAIVEALVPSYLATAFALPQQELQLLMDFVMARAPQALTGVLIGWGRSSTEMPIIPLACISAAARAFKTWSENRPVWPNLAAGEALPAAEFFCSCTRALQPLLTFDNEDSLFASQVMCLYTTVICEEAAIFSEDLKQQQHAVSRSVFPPPHVDAWRSDPLHAALNLLAHACSLLCPSPKRFSSLRLPHPRCFCPPLSSTTNLSGTSCIRSFIDGRWEQCMWHLLLTCVHAVECSGLHRLHRKLCSDRALILSRCISRTMQMLHASSSGFADASYRLAVIRPLLVCGLRLAWGEHYDVVTACCDIACEVFTTAQSLSPTLSNECVVEMLQVFTALASAEPEQEELLRAVESKVNAASRLLHVSTDSIFYQLSGRGSCQISCDTQLDVHKRDLHQHMLSLTASFAQAPVQSSIFSPLPTCVHRGHVLRVSALACLRVLLLRHTSTLTDPVLSLWSIYR
jgi:hypothetical protein